MLQDDLAVQRTGGGAPLTLVINDGGTVTCNGRPAVAISDPQLVQARYLNTTVAPEAKQRLTLAPGPQPVFHYVVRTPDGRVSFSDDSAHVPAVLDQIELLTLQVAQQDCHLTP